MLPPKPPNLWRVLPAMGLTQIIAWGTLYYPIAVLGEAMRHDLAIDETLLFGAFTAGLFVSGLASPLAGRLVDAHGGRAVLIAGSVLAAVALAILAAAGNVAMFVLGWMVAGVAMAACLYDPAFATLGQLVGPGYRRAVTLLTLFGGFASTVFWPISFALQANLGWRNTLFIYALLHLVVSLPVYAWVLPKRAARAEPVRETAEREETPAAGSLHGYAWLGTAFALSGFVFSALAVHLIGLLRNAGVSAADAVFVASCIGPMQVLGRVVEYSLSRWISITSAGIAAFTLMTGAILLLPLVKEPGVMAMVYVAAYGVSNGVMTIVRGAAPAELFGRDRLGALLGGLARPTFVAGAIAPLGFAAVLGAGLSNQGAILCLALLSALAAIAFAMAVRARRAQAWARTVDG